MRNIAAVTRNQRPALVSSLCVSAARERNQPPFMGIQSTALLRAVGIPDCSCCRDDRCMNEQRKHAFAVLRSVLEPLRPFFDDPSVVEIMVNGPSDVWVESRGVMVPHKVDLSSEVIHTAIRQIAQLNGRNAVEGTETGIVDAEIPVAAVASPGVVSAANMRLAAVLAPTALRGHALCIRKHSPIIHSLEDYERNGAFTPNLNATRAVVEPCPVEPDAIREGGGKLSELLRWMLRSKKTILVSGATGSGKTTLFKMLITLIPRPERLFTIEDTPELVVYSPNYVSLLSNTQDGVTPQLLAKLAMRMRPDRILFGELRDDVAHYFLEAANTGHPGSTATLHANDATSALTRLESLAVSYYRGGTPPLAAVRHRIVNTVDFVIHVGKDGRPGVIEEIVAVSPTDAQQGMGYAPFVRSIYSRYPSSAQPH